MLEKIAYTIRRLITEVALERYDLEVKITGSGKPLVDHIIKVLRYQDQLNYNKHINDIDDWLSEIENFKAKKQRVKIKYYVEWVFDERLKSFNKRIKALDKKYKDCKIIRSDQEVLDIINRIKEPICRDLISNDFSTIKEYDEAFNGSEN